MRFPLFRQCPFSMPHSCFSSTPCPETTENSSNPSTCLWPDFYISFSHNHPPFKNTRIKPSSPYLRPHSFLKSHLCGRNPFRYSYYWARCGRTGPKSYSFWARPSCPHPTPAPIASRHIRPILVQLQLRQLQDKSVPS